jgi:hypothetical protein
MDEIRGLVAVSVVDENYFGSFHSRAERPFSGWSKAKSALDTASGVSGWWLHDLRRTLATGLQRLGVRLEVTEAVLNHLSGSRGGVVGIYQRHDWAEEKRAAVCAPSRRGGRQAACRKGVAHLD